MTTYRIAVVEAGLRTLASVAAACSTDGSHAS
jgi:hypothetical protein